MFSLASFAPPKDTKYTLQQLKKLSDFSLRITFMLRKPFLITFFFFRDGMEGESQRPALSPPARVSEKSLPVR